MRSLPAAIVIASWIVTGLLGVAAAFALIHAAQPWWAQLAVFPLAVLVGIAPVYLLGWLMLRESVRRFFAVPYELSLEPAPETVDWPLTAVDAELHGLHYRRTGALVRQGVPGPRTLFYFHETLPVCVLASAVMGPRQPQTIVQMESFFSGGGRLTTTTAVLFALIATIGEAEVPRLVQLRPRGSPAALDGQHVGTVRAWMAGGRKPVTLSAETLAACLTEDRARLREEAGRAGWLPMRRWWQWVRRRNPAVLRF